MSHANRLEDTALSVNEAFRSVLATVPPDSLVCCVMEADPGAVRVSIAYAGVDLVELDSLGSTILSELTNDLEFGNDAGIDFTVSNRS